MDAVRMKAAQRFVSKYVARDPQLAAVKDDLIQEALMGVWAAQVKFDPTRGANRTSFEWLYMRLYVSRFLKFRVLPHRVARSIEMAGDEVEGALNNCPDGGTPVDDVVQARHDYGWFVEYELPRRLRKSFKNLGYRAKAHAMVLARIEGATLQEVGTQFGVSRERVRQVTAKLGVNLE